MNVSNEFSRYAEHYGEYNVIQRKVADRLVSGIEAMPQRLLDIGCGSGAIARRIDWAFERLIAVDFAPRMLELHPKAEQIECHYGDFNDPELYRQLQQYHFDRIVSASALQWSPDLSHTFELIRTLNAPVSLAIFTSGTFRTLFETAGLPPLLRSASEIESLAKHYFNVKCETVRYSLAFENVRDMFRYIKRSGVSGNRNVLSYKETKQLMEAYPLDYLEFEVLFIEGTPI
jgi:malonyl-CoA O-methyltransferase